MSSRRVKFLIAFSLLAALAVWWDFGAVRSLRPAAQQRTRDPRITQRQYDAREKLWRTMVARRTYVLGPEHKETVRGRGELAYVLLWGGKIADAEKEFRAVLSSEERLYGAEHVYVFKTCGGLTYCLREQGKPEEALEFAQRAENGYLKTYGAKSIQAQGAKHTREAIEAQLKEKEAEERGK